MLTEQGSQSNQHAQAMSINTVGETTHTVQEALNMLHVLFG